MPSSTAIVLNSRAMPPAAWIASLTMRPTGARWVCPGTNSVKLFATAMIGLPMSAAATPVARSSARAPAMLRPWVTVRDRRSGMVTPSGASAPPRVTLPAVRRGVVGHLGAVRHARPEQPVDDRVVQGLPGRLEDVRPDADGHPGGLRGVVHGLHEHAGDRVGAVLGVQDPHLEVDQLEPVDLRVGGRDGLAQGGVQGVDRAVALGGRDGALPADVHLHGRLGARLVRPAGHRLHDHAPALGTEEGRPLAVHLLAEHQLEGGVGGVVGVATAEGNGPVNALDAALRKAVSPTYPEIDRFELIDFKVRILDTEHGTDAITRVLVETMDNAAETTWMTVGVGPNIVEASWEALNDAIVYGLLRAGVPNRSEAPDAATTDCQ